MPDKIRDRLEELAALEYYAGSFNIWLYDGKEYYIQTDFADEVKGMPGVQQVCFEVLE